MTKEALAMLEMIIDMVDNGSNITMAQAIDLVRGRKIKSYWIKDFLIEKYKGDLKMVKDDDLRRTIIKMLKTKILKESFQ